MYKSNFFLYVPRNMRILKNMSYFDLLSSLILLMHKVLPKFKLSETYWFCMKQAKNLNNNVIIVVIYDLGLFGGKKDA